MSKHRKTTQSHKMSSSRSYISSSDEEDETSSSETSSGETSSEGEDETTILQPNSLKRKRQHCPQVSTAEQDYDDDASTIHCDQVLHSSKRRKRHKSKNTRNSSARGNKLRRGHSSKPLTSSSGNNSDSNGQYSDTTTDSTTASESESEDNNHSKVRQRNFRVKLIADGSMYGKCVKASSVRMLINKLKIKFQRICPGHVIDYFLLEIDGDSIELTKDTIELDFLQRNITIKVMSHISRSHKRVTTSSRKQVDSLN